MPPAARADLTLDLMAGNLRYVLTAAVILTVSAASAAEKADLVQVKKSEARLYLMRDGTPFKSFPVVFGAHPRGHKQQAGDGRTPEGRYVLDYKKANSDYYRAIHISYPNETDVANAKALGVDPGGAIMIHGQKNGFAWLTPVAQLMNWTNGCIALSNKDMKAVWAAVDAGTPIEIDP